MTQATQPHTTTLPRPRVNDVTPPCPAAPSETWLRVLAPSFEQDETWKRRDPVNKVMFALSGAADRLGGLAEICLGMNLAEMRQGGQWAGEAGLRHPYGFIAKTLSDVAKGLREANKLYSAEMDREDAEALRAARRVGK